MTSTAVVLGFLMPLLDHVAGPDWTDAVPAIRSVGVEGARAILTTLAGAVLGVAGVVFSITIVAVSFASSNYGPRLIGNFMADRFNQVVLGIFVATFVFCIVVLLSVHGATAVEGENVEAFVPRMSLMFALTLTLFSVGALIGYIHHIPESINIMNITGRLGHKLRHRIIDMLKERDEEDGVDGPIDISAWQISPDDKRDGASVLAPRSGYLQQIDLTELSQVAARLDRQIQINRTPGDFLTHGEPVLTVLSAGTLDHADRASLENALSFGLIRTDFQDALFLSDQLVEVAVRALSPGVNDPSTAVLCLDWLSAGLEAFAGRPPSAPVTADAPVLYGHVTFEAMLDRTFDRLRQHVASDTEVTLHALRVLCDIAAVACREPMAAACVRQIERIADSAVEMSRHSLARADIKRSLATAIERVEASGTGEVGGATARSA